MGEKEKSAVKTPQNYDLTGCLPLENTAPKHESKSLIVEYRNSVDKSVIYL